MLTAKPNTSSFYPTPKDQRDETWIGGLSCPLACAVEK